MKKPIAIEIAPGRWVNIAYKEVTKGDAEGEYFYDEGEFQIELKKSLRGHASLSALIHELTHAGFDVAGLTELFTLKQEEAICKLNEMIFTHLIRLDLNNKHIRWADVD